MTLLEIDNKLICILEKISKTKKGKITSKIEKELEGLKNKMLSEIEKGENLIKQIPNKKNLLIDYQNMLKIRLLECVNILTLFKEKP